METLSSSSGLPLCRQRRCGKFVDPNRVDAHLDLLLDYSKLLQSCCQPSLAFSAVFLMFDELLFQIGHCQSTNLGCKLHELGAFLVVILFSMGRKTFRYLYIVCMLNGAGSKILLGSTCMPVILCLLPDLSLQDSLVLKQSCLFQYHSTYAEAQAFDVLHHLLTFALRAHTI